MVYIRGKNLIRLAYYGKRNMPRVLANSCDGRSLLHVARSANASGPSGMQQLGTRRAISVPCQVSVGPEDASTTTAGFMRHVCREVIPHGDAIGCPGLDGGRNPHLSQESGASGL